ALQLLVALQIEQGIFAMSAIEFLRHVVHKDIVPILAPKAVITISREHLNLVPLNPHQGNVKRATTKVENEHGLIFVEFVQSVAKRSSGRFVNNLQNVQARQTTGRDRRGSLRIVEICRNRDHGVRYRRLEILLRIGFELLQNERGELLSGIFLPSKLAVELLL